MATNREEQSPSSRDTKIVLLVEDDINIGEVLVQAITQETPFDAILVADGLQALHKLESLTPDLLILDYQLPHMNGIELFDRIQSSAHLAHIPTIMMSARLPTSRLEKRRILGMNKPIDLDEFLQTIERLLQ